MSSTCAVERNVSPPAFVQYFSECVFESTTDLKESGLGQKIKFRGLNALLSIIAQVCDLSCLL